MREIKFRIWDNNYNQYDNQGLSINKSGEVFIPKSGTIVKNAIVEQYTGLKDKNGVDIYDGDKYWYEYHNPLTGKTSEIEDIVSEFIQDTAYISLLLEDENCYNLTVIGNIHE